MKLATALLAVCSCLTAQSSVDQSYWSKPFPPHRVIGPVHYVGTADLACFLITSAKGHILINTGLADSATLIRKNVESLGFKIADIKILLTNQAHFDHVAALAEIKKSSGAQMFATAADKPVLEDGGRSDFFLSAKYIFAPVSVDRVIKDGEVISLGDVQIRAHLTPGHTKGSVTFSMLVKENGRNYNVVFANIGTVIGAKLINNPKYPEIAKDFERTFRLQKALACDIFLAAHGSQYELRKKYKGSYDPNTFVDPDGYRNAIATAERNYHQQLKQEQTGVR